MTHDKSMFGHGESSRLLISAETLIITLVIPAIGIILNQEDFLFLDSKFPWLLFPPMLLGGRHGFIFGLTSPLIILGLIILGCFSAIYGQNFEFPYYYALAIMLTGMITGQLADYWYAKLKRVKDFNTYAKRELGKFSNSYLLLKKAHDKLEERLADDKYNFRYFLTQINLHIRENYESPFEALQENAQNILDFFLEYTSVDEAEIYKVVNNKNIENKPLAGYNQEKNSLSNDNPLLKACLEHTKLVAINDEVEQFVNRDTGNSYLAMVPMADIYGNMHAVLAIREMPFIHFNDESLNLLDLLCRYMGASLTEITITGSNNSGLSKQGFSYKFNIWHHIFKSCDLDSTIVEIVTKPEMADMINPEEIRKEIMAQLNDIDDFMAFTNQEGNEVISILLPATSEAASQYFKNLVINNLQEYKGSPNIDIGHLISINSYSVDEYHHAKLTKIKAVS